MSEVPGGGAPRICVRLDGEEPREVCVVDGDTLGRDPENKVVLDHPSISRRHASLRATPQGGLELLDLGSLNGARLNGRVLHEAASLHHGDRITLGEVDLVFLHEAGPLRSHDTEHALLALRPAAESEIAPRAEFGLVLVCDTPACASLAQSLPGARVQEWLDGWWDEVRALLSAHDAEVDTRPRDGLLAYWGVAHREAPASEVNVALRATLALFELARRHMQEFQTRFGEARFAVTLGVHIGDVEVVRREGTQVEITAGEVTEVALRLAASKREDACAAIVSWNVARWAAFGFRFGNLGDIAVSRAGDDRVIAAVGLDPDGSS